MCNEPTTVPINIKGHIQGIDPCIAPLVEALNNTGFRTVASCCGHGHRPGVISLDDGRELIVATSYDQAREVEQAFPLTSHGEPRTRSVPFTEVVEKPCPRCGGPIYTEVAVGPGLSVGTRTDGTAELSVHVEVAPHLHECSATRSTEDKP